MRPRTRYVKHEGVRIAYQVVGDGQVDLLVVPGFISHLDLSWAMPSVTAMFRRLASFSRLILYDKAGTGISDPIAHVPTLEERMDEVNVVMDAAGSERAALLGLSEGGLMSVLFAATYPERTRALALYGAFPCGSYDEALPAELREPAERLTAEMFAVVERWGEGWISGDKKSWNLGFFERAAATRSMARGMVEVGQQLDVRPALGAVHAPTVVIHRSDDPFPVGVARWMAGRIPGARFVELPGNMHPMWRGDMHAVVDEIEALVTGAPTDPPADRGFVTVLSTDIAGAPQRELQAARDSFVERHVERFRGRPVQGTGGGVLAAFDGPARAIRCGHAIASAAPFELGAAMRVGVHAGECEITSHGLRGATLEIGTGLAQLAGPGEVLVTSSVRNLVAGSGLAFDDYSGRELTPVTEGLSIHALNTADEGALEATPQNPALAIRPIDSLTLGERLRLVVARYAPGMGRVLSRSVARLRARLS